MALLYIFDKYEKYSFLAKAKNGNIITNDKNITHVKMMSEALFRIF